MSQLAQPIDRLATLARLFPNCVTETHDATTGSLKLAIDFDQLRQELAGDVVDGPRERYRLEWPGKRAASQAANAPAASALVASPASSIDFHTTRNAFIEGDNLEGLKILQKTHAGRVKVIFIDPPYNGGRALGYQDTFRLGADAHRALQHAREAAGGEEAQGRFHAAWLNMMYPRLKLAWRLLADDGLMAVAIDDREVLQLGKLLDEIFGADNRLACAPWLSEASGGREKTGLRCGHEYILLYVKGDRSQITRQTRDEEPLNLLDATGPYRKGRELHKWGGASLRADRPNQFYPLTAPNGKQVLPYRHDGKAGHWRWGKDNPRIIQALTRPHVFHWEMRPYDAGVQVDGQTQRWVPYEKIRETQKSVGWSTWLDGVGTNADGTRELKALFGAKVFDTPKPTSLMQWVLSLHQSTDALVLDFFAGSASTAHAVWHANREDGGRRRFIMVQHAEPCPAQSLTAQAGYQDIAAMGRERLRLAGLALKESGNAQHLDLGYRHYRIG